ncbi:hypothetical protein Zm00014a_014441 [Zea mays]|uniref:Uncharacterized protein n=1 Tax=Zea mays TaxID=4577 RepID=A0A3L6DJU5_MAIZE|nr:hypothetical protein Zm00014a_014441 [Zea mays]
MVPMSCTASPSPRLLARRAFLWVRARAAAPLNNSLNAGLLCPKSGSPPQPSFSHGAATSRMGLDTPKKFPLGTGGAKLALEHGKA